MSEKNNANEIRIKRLYDAPIAMVWDAWIDPAQAAQWWGPRGFTITTLAKDLRPGGHWTYIMHGPDGTDYPNKAQYLEVEKHAKLVYDHGGNDDQPPMFRVTVTFSEKAGKTTMDMRMALPTPEAAAATRKFVKQANGESTWDRLAEYLAKRTLGKEKFVINRSFDAPLELMFQMWSDPKHMAQWVAPAGFEVDYIKADIRDGGSAFYVMTGNGVKMYGRVAYLKIEQPQSLVYHQQFCDQYENLTRHPMAPTWPETMATTVQFTQEGPGQTRLTLTWEPHGPITDEELATFINARSGMTQGWTGSFDHLEAYLAIPR